VGELQGLDANRVVLAPAHVLVGQDAFARWDEFRRARIKQWPAELGS
jgi:hypothetical protein